MNRQDRVSDPELDTLIEQGKTIRPLPDLVRARALARARAAVTAAGAQLTVQAAPRSRHRFVRIALAASVALAVGAAGVATAVLLEKRRHAAAPPPPDPMVASPTETTASHRLPELPPAVPTRVSKATVQHSTPPAAIALESYAAELGLLQRVQATYVKRDYAGALALVAEHARRFPNGRLAEEREAFRVRALTGSGRVAEARRATAAFARRFPRSVLLAHLRGTSGAAEE